MSTNLHHAFDDISQAHESHTRRHPLKHYFYRDLIHKFLIHLDPQPQERIIELACGNAFYGGLCRERGAMLQLLDINQGMLRRATVRLGAANVGGATQGDIRHLPFETAAFDKTICFGAFPPLPTLTEVEQAIGEFVRITRTGGRVFFTYNPPHILRHISVRYWRWRAATINPSMRHLPFIDGRTDGTHSHEAILAMVNRLGMSYSHDIAGQGVFGLVCIEVSR